MKYKYSPSTGGFYLESIHGSTIPADAVDITQEQHKALLAGQGEGKQIVAGAGGIPELQDAPPVSLDDQVDAMINSDVKLQAIIAANPATFESKYRQELKKLLHAANQK